MNTGTYGRVFVPESFDVLPQRLWFGGIMEGQRAGPDMDALLVDVTERINGLGLARVELEIEGGHFSLLMDDQVLVGDRLLGESRQRFVEELQRIVVATADPSGLESTLRCTEIYADHAVETLFAPLDGKIQGFGRSRPLTPKDSRGLVQSAPSVVIPPELRDRRALLLVGAVVLLIGLLAWQRGFVDRLFSGDATELTLEMAGLQDCLALEVTNSWGNYEVTVVRGKGYPASTEDGKALLAQGKTPAELALLRAVVEGGVLFLRLENDKGIVLEVEELNLRALLASEKAKIQGKLPGRIDAKVLRIALVSGKRR